MDKAKQLSLKAAWKLDEGSAQGGRGQAAARQTCALLLMHLPVPCLVGSFRKLGVFYFGVVIIRLLLYSGSPISETAS